MTKLPETASEDTIELNPEIFGNGRRKMFKDVPRNKFKANKVEVGGKSFDSKAEYHRFLELCAMQQGGTISNLEHKPEKLLLQGSFTDKWGTKHQPITYAPDFLYLEDDHWVYEDVKGGRATQTEAFSIRWKLAAKQYALFEFRKVVR